MKSYYHKFLEHYYVLDENRLNNTINPINRGNLFGIRMSLHISNQSRKMPVNNIYYNTINFNCLYINNWSEPCL